METINWSGRDWYPREEWGLIHPDKPWNWYDPSCIVKTGTQLHLHVKKNPRIFTLPDNNGGEYKVRSPYGVGLISSVDYYEYGTFEIYAKLPKGRGLWPAFWLYDHNDWPPEIDIFEGYSGVNGNYRNGIIKRLFYPYNVESCFHSHQELNIPNIKPKAYNRKQVIESIYNPFSYNLYSLTWTRNALIFSINYRIVRVIANPDIMNYLAGRKMRVLINTHIQKGFENSVTYETPFSILYFDYEKETN